MHENVIRFVVVFTELSIPVIAGWAVMGAVIVALVIGATICRVKYFKARRTQGGGTSNGAADVNQGHAQENQPSVIPVPQRGVQKPPTSGYVNYPPDPNKVPTMYANLDPGTIGIEMDNLPRDNPYEEIRE